MNKQFYSFGNVFFGLGVVSGLNYSVIYLLVGPKILTMDAFLWSFPGWTLIQLAGSLFLLKYYGSKGFTLALKAGWVVVLLNLVLVMMFFAVLKSHELQPIFVSIVRLSLLCGVVYGAVLIFSAAGKIHLLKWTGIVIVVFTVPTLIGAAWASDPERSAQLVKMDQWTSFFRNAIPILFMIQFFRERKSASGELGRLQERRGNLYGFGALLAFVFTMVAGVSLAREGLGSLQWEKLHARQTAHLINISNANTFTGGDGETLTYLLTKLIDYDSTKKYPLVVCLPYGEYSAPMADLLAEDANRRNFPSFIFTPYARKGTSWGGTPDKFPMVYKD